jgi:hypothetical protein
MSIMRPTLFAALALLPLAGSAQAKPTASSAKAFLEALYVPYRAEPTKVVDALERPELYFESALVKAMSADSAAAAQRNEVPMLDGDPICDCQDYIPFRPAIGPIRLNGNRADATVRFNNGSERELQYRLIATKNGWRIHDIRTRDYSLRGMYKL